jgi:hypothetical protein
VYLFLIRDYDDGDGDDDGDYNINNKFPYLLADWTALEPSKKPLMCK